MQRDGQCQPQHRAERDREHRNRAEVHLLPPRRRHQRARSERRNAHRREHDEVVRALRLAPSRRARRPRSSSVVPPVYMKFQPMPTRTSATRKCATVSPASATATQLAINATPATMIVSTPKRLIRSPVTNPGAYMPTTCHWITIAACAYGMRAEAHRERRRDHQQVHEAVAQRTGQRGDDEHRLPHDLPRAAARRRRAPRASAAERARAIARPARRAPSRPAAGTSRGTAWRRDPGPSASFRARGIRRRCRPRARARSPSRVSAGDATSAAANRYCRPIAL